MSKRSPKVYLDDILEAIAKIESYTSGMNFDSFSANDLVIDAVIRNIEVIGEAANKLSEEIKEQHSQVPWQQIIGTRNKVAHEYFGVDLQIIWHTLQEELPDFQTQIKEIHSQLTD